MSKRKKLNEVFGLSQSYADIPNLKRKLENDEEIILEAVIQRANKKNQNGRIYTKELLDREFSKYKKEFMNQNRALGELDHPSDDRVIVEYKTACIKLLDWWWSGDDVIGKIKILSGKFFPMANILRGCLKDDIPIGFSTRGVGSEIYIDNDTIEVDNDFEIICVDAVPNPSTHRAFGKVTESMNRENFNNFKNVINKIDQTIYNILS